MWIEANGVPSSSWSVIDWAHSKVPVQHSYNIAGLLGVAAGGTVAVTLCAASLNGGTFAVGAASNLAAFVLPAHVTATSASLPADTLTYAFDVQPTASPMPAFVECVGSDQNWPGCPSIGPTTTFANSTFTVPEGHSGVVYFSLKSIVQGDPSDPGGIVAAQIAIDGVRVGSAGVQQLQSPDGVSTRTITAGYLAAGAARLAAGVHTIAVLVDVSGSFIHVCLGKQLSLVWIG